MNKTTRITAAVVGGYAGILGVVHGVFEFLQGNSPTSGLLINAVGAPCQVEAAWHACLPAVTIVPSFRLSGTLAVFVSLSIFIWAVFLLDRKQGGLVLVVLSIPLLLVGGGFVPALTAIIAGIAGTRIHAPLAYFRKRLPERIVRFLSMLWPWALIGFTAWSAGGWILGTLFNDLMLFLGPILFPLDLLLPILAVLTGMGRDVIVVNNSE